MVVAFLRAVFFVAARTVSATAAQQPEIDALVASLKARIGNRPSERTFRYQLDDNTNRLQTVERLTAGGATTTTTYVPDGQDRYQTVGNTTPAYDRAGNLLADGRNSYRYDAYNNLAEVQTPSGSLTLSRDPLTRPIQLHGPAGVEEATFAGVRRIEWRTGGTVVGQVVPLERPNQYAHLATGGTDYAPIFDAMDSVIGWVRSDGTLAGKSSYDPFGQVLQREAVWPAPFGFAGYWHENLSQTYLLPVRAYHPRFGRYLQRDPLGFADGTNLYAYAHHAPGTLTDYWDLSSNDIDWGTVAWEGVKTVAIGGAIIAGGAALVGAGLVSAPVLALVGGIALVGMGINAYFVRASEALDAGQTDFSGRAALAAAGDALPLNITGIYEGVTGRSAVTDRALGTERRSAVVGGLFGGVALGPLAGSFGRVGANLGKRLPGSSTRAMKNSIAQDLHASPSVEAPPRVTSPTVIIEDAEMARQAVTSQGAPKSILASSGGPVPTIRPMRAGESAIDYGNFAHEQGLGRYLQQTDPSAELYLNVQRGQTGPDVWPLTDQYNAVVGELKPIGYSQSKLLAQIRNWGLDPAQVRLYFYDRQGNFYEGMLQLE